MSTRYHVYGLGNALVDMEFEVEDAFLQQHGIPKGHMTLVDAERQAQLASELAAHQPRRGSGGSAANSLIAVSAFGGNAFYSCKVADDETGKFFVRDLNAAGVATNAHLHHEAGVSGQCLVLVTPDAERSMNSFLGISSSLSRAEVDADALAASEILYMEGYLCTSDSAREAVVHARQKAREQGVRVFATLSDPSMVELFKPQLSEMLGDHVDHLFCNEEEALDWTGTRRIEDAAEALRGFADSFSITLGAKGSLIWTGSEQLQVPAEPVKAVDTNGAGDIYAGAFMYGLTHGLGHEGAAQLATRAAARLITRFGPRLPLEEHRELLPATA